MATKKFLTAAIRRRIQKMMDYVKTHTEMYNQNAYPENTHGDICGTPFCAAGFAVLANKPERFKELAAERSGPSWRREALESLGLDIEPYGSVSSSIFGCAFMWPIQFHKMYAEAGYKATSKERDRQRVKAFLARWQHFIDTDGAE